MSKKPSFGGNVFNNFEALNPEDYALAEARRIEQEEEAARAQESIPVASKPAAKNTPPVSGAPKPPAARLPRPPKARAPRFDPKAIDPQDPDDIAFMQKWHPDTPITEDDRGAKMKAFAEGLRDKYKTEDEQPVAQKMGRGAVAVETYKKQRAAERLARRNAQQGPRQVNEDGPGEEEVDEEPSETLETNEEVVIDEETEAAPVPAKKKSSGGFKPFDINTAKLSRKDEIAIEDAKSFGPIPLNRLQQRLDDALDETNFQERRRALLFLYTAIQQGVTPSSKKKKGKNLSEQDAQVVEEISKEIQSLLSEAEESVGEKVKSKDIKGVLQRLKQAREEVGGEEEPEEEEEQGGTNTNNLPKNSPNAKSPEEVKLDTVKEVLSGKLSNTEFVNPAQAMSEPGFIAFCNKVSEESGWDYESDLDSGYSDRMQEAFETFVKARELVSVLKDTYRNDIEKKTDGALQLPADAQDCIDLYVIDLASSSRGSYSEINDLLGKCLIYKHGPASIKRHEEELVAAHEEWNSESLVSHYDANINRERANAHLLDLISKQTIEVTKDNAPASYRKLFSEKFVSDPRISTGRIGKIFGSVKRMWNPDGYLSDVSGTLSSDRVQLESFVSGIDSVATKTDADISAKIAQIEEAVLGLAYDKKGYISEELFDQDPAVSPREQITRIKAALIASQKSLDDSIKEVTAVVGKTKEEKVVDKYSEKEQVRLAQDFAEKNKHLFDKVDKKQIARNPQAWISQAIDEMEGKIQTSKAVIDEVAHKIRTAQAASEAVRESFSTAKARIFEEVANGADVREAVIRHALEKIQGKGKKKTAATLQARRDVIAKIDTFVEKTRFGTQERATDLETFTEDDLQAMAAEIEKERVDLLVAETNKTLDKVKIGTLKFDALRKTLLAAIDGVKDKDGNIIENNTYETNRKIVEILREINEGLRDKEVASGTKDPRRAVISSIIFDLVNSH